MNHRPNKVLLDPRQCWTQAEPCCHLTLSHKHPVASGRICVPLLLYRAAGPLAFLGCPIPFPRFNVKFASISPGEIFAVKGVALFKAKQGAKINLLSPKTKRIIKGEKRHLLVKFKGVSQLPSGPTAIPSYGPLASHEAKVCPTRSGCSPQQPE